MLQPNGEFCGSLVGSPYATVNGPLSLYSSDSRPILSNKTQPFCLKQSMPSISHKPRASSSIQSWQSRHRQTARSTLVFYLWFSIEDYL